MSSVRTPVEVGGTPDGGCDLYLPVQAVLVSFWAQPSDVRGHDRHLCLGTAFVKGR